MALTARNTEKEAILQLLDQQIEIPADDRAEWLKFSGQLLRLAHSLLAGREQWLIHHELVPGGPASLIGWYASQKDAEKAATVLPGGVAFAVRVRPWTEVQEAHAEELETYSRLFGNVPCVDCGHAEWAHGAWRLEKGQLKKATTPAGNRCEMGCSCKGYVHSPAPSADGGGGVAEGAQA